MSTVFITGTDTEVGKTHVAVTLLHKVAAGGTQCAGFKPVAAGAQTTAQGLRNDDALALQAAGNVGIDYDTINPYCFGPPVAPHLAADREGVRIEKARIMAAHKEIAARADWVLVEGAGGWRVPLNADMDFADLVAQAGWPVVLVVGMRLGCLNHAILSAESIMRSSHLLGWVANCLPPEQPMLQDNIKTLEIRMPAPLLGTFPADGKTPEKLDIQTLINT